MQEKLQWGREWSIISLPEQDDRDGRMPRYLCENLTKNPFLDSLNLSYMTGKQMSI